MVTMNSISVSLEGFTSLGLSSLESTRRNVLLSCSLSLFSLPLPVCVSSAPLSLSPSSCRADYISFLDRSGHLNTEFSDIYEATGYIKTGFLDEIWRHPWISIVIGPPKKSADFAIHLAFYFISVLCIFVSSSEAQNPISTTHKEEF